MPTDATGSARSDRESPWAAPALALAAELSDLHTLAAVIRWGLAQAPERVVVDVVIQDEYSHDVVMDWDDGSFLVFDTT